METKILIKSIFGEWTKISKKEALAYAKWKIRAIRTCKTNKERLAIVNTRFKGIKFSLKDLLIK